jgi:hypothetical protein
VALQDIDGDQRGLLLHQVHDRAGHLHRLPVRSQPEFLKLCAGQQDHLDRLHGHPGRAPPRQAIILIDLFYLAGIKLVARYDQGESSCAALLIFLSIIFEAIAIAFNVLGYIYFSASDVCGSSLWVNVITSVILLALPFTQLLHYNKQNSLLTTAMVSMYVSYLAFICQFSYGGKSCTLYSIKAPGG